MTWKVPCKSVVRLARWKQQQCKNIKMWHFFPISFFHYILSEIVPYGILFSLKENGINKLFHWLAWYSRLYGSIVPYIFSYVISFDENHQILFKAQPRSNWCAKGSHISLAFIKIHGWKMFISNNTQRQKHVNDNDNVLHQSAIKNKKFIPIEIKLKPVLDRNIHSISYSNICICLFAFVRC